MRQYRMEFEPPERSPRDMSVALTPYEAALKAFFERETTGTASAYLFGSEASGTAHRESDIDVGVLLDWTAYPDRSQRFDARLRLSGEISRHVGRREVDVVILNDAPPHLTRAIVTKGRRVFCRDPEADHAMVRTALLRSADLEPFLRRMRRVKLEAIRR